MINDLIKTIIVLKDALRKCSPTDETICVFCNAMVYQGEQHLDDCEYMILTGYDKECVEGE